jgi:hypothetical protein
LATNTSKMSRPASSRNKVFTPQMTEADRVNSPEMMRYARTTWLGVVAAVLAVPNDAIRRC